MAYGPGRRVARFSNPRVLFGGVPSGADRQDNARSLNELRVTASRFRPSLPPPRVISLPDSARNTTRFRVASEEPPVIEWRILLGTSPGASDVADSGTRNERDTFDAGISSPETLRIYGRLWYRRGATWLHQDFRVESP
jgi:hypothetical protein